ncbi:hypothetical protein Btru_001020 [Bulinus truncatus]|nr:hypothetical protein Btru_001020 [Bulinus truncatus]
MLTTFLDGTNPRPFHERIMRSEFYNVTSMIFYNQTFIWTNKTKMFGEEQESPLKDYRHNELLFFEPPFTGIDVFHPSSQPTPVPSSAPDNVEALFSRSKGAWMNWTYELNLTRLSTRQWNIYSVSKLKHSITNLSPNTEYSIQVRAQSTAGDGPWSKIFIGKTLIDDDLSILMGVAEAEIQSSILEDDIEDIAWHENIVFWVTQLGTLTFYNQTSQQKRPLHLVEKAYCVAYDWLGEKVFWSDPSHVAIYRSDINGIHSEFIRRSAARDMAIDATRGRLYWATQNSIETCYLNGEQHQELFAIPPFSGPNVISLTLDFDSKESSDTQSLYMTKLIPENYVGQYPTNPEKVGDFKSISSISGLQYFSHRLFWLSEKNSLVVGDMQCNFTATISSNFTKTKPRVIPYPIKSVDIRTEDNIKKLEKTIYGFSPYTQIVVSIQPYTYWGYADPTTVSVRSPMSKPSAPLSPEVYVIEHKNTSASYQTLAADFRWMSPAIINGIISHHLVYYWMGEDMNGEKTEVRVKGTMRNFILSPLVKNQTYHFKVIACTEAGCGQSSAIKTCVTNALNPVPKLLVSTSKGIGITEMDGVFTNFITLDDNPPKSIAFLHQDDLTKYWLNKRNELFVSNESSEEKLLTLNGTGKDITVDWVSRTLYFVESVSTTLSSVTQYNIDTKSYQLLLTRPAIIHAIAADPFNSIILWLENSNTGEEQIMSADMRNGNIKTVLSAVNPNRNKRGTTCTCPNVVNLAPVMAVTYSRIDGGIEIVFSDSQTGTIYSTDINGCKCTKITGRTVYNFYGLPPSLLAVDHLRVSWYNQSENRLYSVNKATGEGLTSEELHDATDMVALGSNLQPLPDAQCQDPGAASSNIQTYEVGVTYIHLNLTTPYRPTSCLAISAPHPKYTLYYRQVKPLKPGAVPEDCQSDLSQCNKLESYSTYIELKNLAPYTQYLIQAAVSNHFYPYLSEALGHPLKVTTEFGAPSFARDVVSKPCTPEKIMVKWLPSLILNGPPDKIFYRVQYSTTLIQKETDNLSEERTYENFIQTLISGLEPGTIYNIKVLACMANRTRCTSSESVSVKTFMTPYNISFYNATSHSVTMSWRSPPDNSILRHQIVYAEVKPGNLTWMESGDLGATENNTVYNEDITGLKPNTLYSFKITASYNFRPFDDAHYIWPNDDNRFTYRTPVFLPDEVPTPDIRQLKSGLYEVKWDRPDDNGAPITNYELEISSADQEIVNWHLVYNGSEERWLVENKELKQGKPYVFRVAAINSQGRGAFSPNSSTFIAPHAITEAGAGHQGTIGIIAGTVAVFVIIIFVIIIVLVIRKRKEKTPHFIIRGPDTELATLRELPHTAFQQSNTLYAISIKCTDEEIAKLPHFSRNQLMLTMFLGSGAFGEVFEGLAKNILGDSTGETKCAVKTLRKSASDHEKEEFLKEALLMKNFQHENILRLLGVCLDNDPQFIIMELMEGGDLLSFLRSCRATATSPVKLLLPDLVKICVHVARGCKYLEDMHFVHRDLAARNCLVSSKFPSDMIVKIGDFGLARDIYKNDYYRKEGEGLLPVRWMSPESLVDGFFTTQSDIWAFGVLMWEVLTLGQQPYPARTNIEVLHFVRDGGKLERPEKCTDEMFALMRKCWSFNSDHRPSFAVLLENLEIFLEKCHHMSPEEIARYSPAVTDVNDDVNRVMSEEDDLIEAEEEEEEEEAVTRGLFTPDKPTWGFYTPKVQTITGGGSVRLTQSGKQKRLKDLLGSPEGTEKLVVDLTKIGRKRTHSLEYSAKSSLDSSMDQFPAASNYDHNGYLEPRSAKNGPGYLELINYAPELRHLRDAHGNPLTMHPSVHMTRKGYHPSHINYTLLTPEENIQTGAFSSSSSDMCGVEDSNFQAVQFKENLYHPSYGSTPGGEEAPIYSRVCDERRHLHSDSSGRQFGNSNYYLHTSGQSMEGMLLKPSRERKYSDQDLYFSTAPYRQRQSSSSSSTRDHRYASVECNNNYSNPSKVNSGVVPGFINDNSNTGYIFDNGGRQRQGSGNSSHLYAKTGLGYATNSSVSFPTIEDNAKSSHDLDDVFLDNTASSLHPDNEAFNYPPQQNHILRSRGQIYPEHATAFVGYDTNQVSLV